MDTIKQYPFAMTFIAVLLVIKFIFMPIIEWQDSQLSDIELLEKKQHKIEQLLENKTSISANVNEFAALLAPLNKRFFQPQNENQFKLQQQKWLESVLASYELATKNIAWELTSTLTNPNLKRYQVKLNITGQTNSLRKFMQHIEAHESFITISNANIGIKGEKSKSLGKTISQLTLQFYMNNENNNE